MAKARIAIVGGVVGATHVTPAYLLDGGRSLHPLQRQGVVAHLGFHPDGAASPPSFGHAPAVGVGPDLGWPATLTPGIALSPAVRV